MAEDDRISRLPDVLLSLILSFLSTKEAVATSTLSKRWESIWTKVPALNFSFNSSGSVHDFKAFVDRVLLCYDSSSLRLFKLSGLSKKQIKDYHYHSWIKNILRRDVDEIDLVHVGVILPAGTFSSKKLTVLKLFGLITPFRGSVHLPSLLILHLKFIGFTDDLPLKNILMSLPLLEELVLFECLGARNMCICSSSLKRLEIIEQMVFREEEENIIDCPRLEYLQIYNGQFSKYAYEDMPALTEARVHVGLGSKERYDVELISLLKHAPNLKTLKLDIATKKPAPGYTERDRGPLFPNLSHVIVDYDFSSTNCSNFSWRYLVLWILQCAPNVVSFDFSSEAGKSKNIRLGGFLTLLGQLELEEFLPQLPTPSTLPKCMFPTLKVVNATLLDVADADKILLEYLLNNAVNLKMVRINFKGSKVDENNKNEIIGWLNEVHRASSECKLIVSPP
ncbi:FBD-associated F-box protein At4g10400-like [Chenopodium quinoa]|uniref:FBD-associated F-box protein At4g10400-like n=1 Tax=Chenopodium quinoa TaxID=63459 RepID=UPI000B79951B|nr:FBD-associated F-box protein At4g10400-like [Chenopodium quinoa]